MMKIAALGDIHGNLQALLTVLDDIDSWQPDLVLVLGDIINRGPRSKECLNRILDRSADPNWHVIRGNHEGYVLAFEDPAYFRSGPEFDMRRVIYWTYQSLSREDLKDIIALPEEITIEVPEGQLIRGFHASLAGDRIGIYPGTSGEKLKRLSDPAADLFLVGHTHQPFIRQAGKSLVINTGSVGLPFDGDTRLGYARIIQESDRWQAEIVRLEYDIKAAEEDYYKTGFIPDGGEMAELILAELHLGWPQLAKFFKSYEKAFLEGKISLADAVKELMLNPNIEYKQPAQTGIG